MKSVCCYGVEKEEGERRREKKERAWEVVASEASLADWLAGQCGVVDF